MLANPVGTPAPSFVWSLFALCAGLVLSGCGPSDTGASAEAASTLSGVTVVTIRFPFTGNSFPEGEEIRFEGSAANRLGEQVLGASLVWTSNLDGEFGAGEVVTTSSLSRGSHEITLTAGPGGSTASDKVFIRVTADTASNSRAGETHPYHGRLKRTPVKRDDEVIVVGHSSADDQMLLGIVDELPGQAGEPVRITSRRDGVVPVAGATGRLIGSNREQAAIITRSSGGGSELSLEILGLSDPGERRIAAHSFTPLFPEGALDLLVVDIDAFEEVTGERALNPPSGVNADYHDDIVLAQADRVDGDLVARIDVLTFETVDFPLDDGEPDLPGATSITTAWTTEPMHPDSDLVLNSAETAAIVAYVDAARRVAVDVFEYEHTRRDPANPDPPTDMRALMHVFHGVISVPLAEEAIASGGWDVVVGRGERLGMDNPLSGTDVLLVVYNDAGEFVQEAWILGDLDGQGAGGPTSVGQASGEFGRVTDFTTEVGLVLLPDTKVEVELGRVAFGQCCVDDCEALGLYVLADTNRGAVIQTMSAFVMDVFTGSIRFGPFDEEPAWPHPNTVFNRPDTDETTNTSLVTGGFVSARNGYIDVNNCQNASVAPLLGPMHPLYVADPEVSELHAVPLHGFHVGAPRIPLDPSIDGRIILLAADSTGDAGYYSSFACAGSQPGDCRIIYLGDAELHYVVENIETSNVILQQPPKHVDYLPALGGIVDVSMREGFYAEFVQTDQSSGSVTGQTKTDWAIGMRGKLGLGPPVPTGTDFSSVFDMSLDAEHRSVQTQFASQQVSVSLMQATGAVDDDVVWSKRQTIDFWRFPAQEASGDDAGLPEDAYMEIAIPDQPVTTIGAGSLNENYQPTHMVGNILSYPTFSGDVTDLGELFGFLGGYVPSDEIGTRDCLPLENGDPNGCLVLINNQLQRVAQVLAGDEFVGGALVRRSGPIDVAQTLQVGGISYSAELEFEESIRNGLNVTNSDTIKAETNLKIPLSAKAAKVPVQFGELDYQLRADASFENSSISENAVGSKTKIALHIPADIPIERSYQIRPSFGFSPGGGLRVAYQVNTGGPVAIFWEAHYSAPDPALSLPHRIIRTADGYQLGTDFSRGRLRGFFVRDGTETDPFEPDERNGPLVTGVPRAGDPLQLQVQITNLSVGTEVLDLMVLFEVKEYRNGELVGESIPIGGARVDFIPYRGLYPDAPEEHIQSAYILWDTTGFGPPPGESLITYMVSVTLDPEDQIPGETHELFDRYGEPLLGPLGEPLDAELERGQNNRGWAMLRLAPSLADGVQSLGDRRRRAGRSPRGNAIQLTLEHGGQRVSGAPLRGRVHEPLQLGVGLRAETPVLDYCLLQVFDGDPETGGQLILSRTVQGISDAGMQEEFVWRPRTPGRRVLHAVYLGTEADDPKAIQIPVIIAE